MVDYWTRFENAVIEALKHVKLDVGELTIGNVKIIDQNSDDKVDVEKLDGGLGAGTLNALMGKVKSFISKSDGTIINPAEEGTLIAIKDTDGIKKITEELPAGTKEIGKVQITDGVNEADIDPTTKALKVIEVAGALETVDIIKIGGTVQTGADLTPLFQNLDIALSALRDSIRGAGTKDFSTLETDIEAILAKIIAAPATEAKQDTLIAKDFATEATLAAQLNITLSVLRDALQGAGTKDFSTLETELALKATEATLALIKAKTDNIPTDPAKESGKLTDIELNTDGIDKQLEEGIATAGNANTLTDVIKDWDVNIWAGSIIRIIAGTGINQTRQIASNTATVITITNNWTTNPNATSKYIIEPIGAIIGVPDVNIEKVGGTAQTGGDWTPQINKLADIEAQQMKRANDYNVVTVDLSVLRATFTALGYAGMNLTIQDKTGDCEMTLSSAGNDVIPNDDLDIGNEISNHDFTDVFIKNTAQAGKILRLWISRRT